MPFWSRQGQFEMSQIPETGPIVKVFYFILEIPVRGCNVQNTGIVQVHHIHQKPKWDEIAVKRVPIKRRVPFTGVATWQINETPGQFFLEVGNKASINWMATTVKQEQDWSASEFKFKLSVVKFKLSVVKFAEQNVKLKWLFVVNLYSQFS